MRLAILLLLVQTGWFQPALLDRPDVRKAIQSIDDRSTAIVDEWIRLVQTDANNAVAMGIPAVAIGAVMEHSPHRLEETADASSIVPGVKSLIALAVALTSHQP